MSFLHLYDIAMGAELGSMLRWEQYLVNNVEWRRKKFYKMQSKKSSAVAIDYFYRYNLLLGSIYLVNTFKLKLKGYYKNLLSGSCTFFT